MHPEPRGLAELAKKLGSGELPLTEHLASTEKTIRRLEPDIQALVPEKNRFTRLEQEANELEKRFPHPEKRPPLYGIPVGIKDIIHVQGFPTRAGSKLPPDILTGPEAACATLLKKAGALILGKTVTTEFAYAASGPTKNPHDLSRTPGGSSSGSAAAVAAGYCALAIGTQTVGSVIRPASFCGIVGFKPSQGRISTQGVIPFSPTLDQVGFLCPHAKDIALAASILCTDWKGIAAMERPLILGLPMGPYLDKADAPTLNILDKFIKSLEKCGHRVKPVQALANFEAIAANHRALMAHEAAKIHKNWHAEFSGLYHPVTTAIIEKGREISPSRAERLRQQGPGLRNELEGLMDSHGLDAWICPSSTGPAPKGFGTTGDPVMNLPWTSAGLPVASLPVMRSGEGLPLGLQLVGRFMKEEKLAATAEAMAADIE